MEFIDRSDELTALRSAGCIVVSPGEDLKVDALAYVVDVATDSNKTTTRMQLQTNIVVDRPGQELVLSRFWTIAPKSIRSRVKLDDRLSITLRFKPSLDPTKDKASYPSRPVFLNQKEFPQSLEHARIEEAVSRIYDPDYFEAQVFHYFAGLGII